MHDEIDANYFSFKSSLSFNEKVFYPENQKIGIFLKNMKIKQTLCLKKITNLSK